MEKIYELKDCVEKITKDAYKFFEKNNKTSGVRARKKLQRCKKLAQEIRMLIQKSKQDHFQKKNALAASTAAFSGAGLINEKNNDISDKSLFDYENSIENFTNNVDIDSENNFFEKKNQGKNFSDEKKKSENKLSNATSESKRTKIDDIPRWNQ
jgi:hypothetical protein